MPLPLRTVYLLGCVKDAVFAICKQTKQKVINRMTTLMKL